MDSQPLISLGLQELSALDYVKVTPRGWRCNRRYEITTQAGDRILTGLKNESCLSCLTYCFWSKLHRALCYRCIAFNVNFVNRNEEKVVNIFHPSCGDCGNDKIKVSVCGGSPNMVYEGPNLFRPKYDICESEDQDQRVFCIEGKVSCCTVPEYVVETPSETSVGKIEREWRFLQPNRYHITFPVDLDVRHKVALIATCVFIDVRTWR